MWDAAAEVAETLAALGGYMAERTDVADVRDRIVAALSGLPAPSVPESAEPYVLGAVDLAPADTATAPPRDLASPSKQRGRRPRPRTRRSSRAPSDFGRGARTGVLDVARPAPPWSSSSGAAGVVRIDPTETEIEQVRAVAARDRTFDGNGRTADGQRVQLLANVGDPKGVAAGGRGECGGPGAVPDRVLLPRAHGGSDRRRAGRRLPRRPRGVPREEGRRPHASTRARTSHCRSSTPLRRANPALGVRAAYLRPIPPVLGTVSVAVVLATGSAVYGLQAPVDPLGVAGWYLAGLTCFIAMGCAIGSLVPSARSAAALGNLVYVPMFLLGRGGPPRQVMTGVMSTLSDALPLSHVVGGLRLAWLGKTDDPHTLWWPLLVSALCVTIAVLSARRNARR